MKRISLTILMSVLYGCSPAEKAPQSLHEQAVATFDGTVSSLCELSGYADAMVEGYGLVCGLRGTGSAECPETLKKYLLNALRTPESREVMGPYYSQLTAEKILQDRSTAVVQVTGIVPAGAPRGQNFDVEVLALSATQTTSLQGGVLLPCDLKIVSMTGVRPVASGTVAVATGAIFINPFPLGQKGDQVVRTDPRKGRIIGGALTARDRQVALTLLEPSWRRAEQVQNRINSRFASPDGPPIAIGLSRQLIQLKVPKAYALRYNHFISLILTLYVDDDPAFISDKLDELNRLVGQTDSDIQLETIALSWESIGKDCLAGIAPLYQSPQGRAAFYAARTAVSLGEHSAMDSLIAMANDPSHPSRTKAIDFLGYYADRPKVRQALLALLDGPDLAARLPVYRALRRAGDSHIRTFEVKRGFWIDAIETTGESMLCIWTTESPRFVLFGPQIPCRDNIFFESSDKTITVNSSASENNLTVIRRLPRGNERIVVKAAPEIGEFIVKLALPLRPAGSDAPPGAGLSFSEIAGLLYEMCSAEHDFILAKFQLESESAGG